MSLIEYLESRRIAAADYEFYALLFAMIRKADNENLEKIRMAWPEKYTEFVARYNAPGGALSEPELEWLIGR